VLVEAAAPYDGAAELSRLRKEERSLSVRRTRLHARIDFLRAGGHAGESSESLEELHERIERISAELAAGPRGA
jgi:hypothetical protein